MFTLFKIIMTGAMLSTMIGAGLVLEKTILLEMYPLSFLLVAGMLMLLGLTIFLFEN